MTNKRLLDSVLASSYISKKEVILGWPSLHFFAIRLVGIGAILRKSDTFETNYIEFLYWVM